MYYFYILKSLKDGKLYKGFTNNLRRRLDEHNAGSSKSTKSRRPFKLMYYEAFSSKEDAMRREKQMKLGAKAWAQLKRRIKNSIEEV
ncbi:GIY-YIG nuclease family protein [Candidatus Saccharibacteria bacterium]|nr:GIY-YIG nuclease family protein [Candidatus Saccharibacteria bacterium]NIV04078.1 GIY-YIG nuclease family protein [Calditrichia bacterium]NIS38635.1 GIY-YIG nuclease family protein [Candidatus Saccharibacteria bacterium]NIV72477.1 GIY-YIG nuclease family protein [Calditrichia bacterium]NIV99583.1 GIY-YIG nuclease family protein [Candidatus Saccharibacteria bacterium]